MRTIATVLALAVVLLAGCSTVQPLAEVSASLTTLPMPSGAERGAVRVRRGGRKLRCHRQSAAVHRGWPHR